MVFASEKEWNAEDHAPCKAHVATLFDTAPVIKKPQGD
jgi:hypothetical protein